MTKLSLHPTLPGAFNGQILNLDYLEVGQAAGGFAVPYIDQAGVLQSDSSFIWNIIEDFTTGYALNDWAIGIMAYLVDVWWQSVGRQAQKGVAQPSFQLQGQFFLNQNGSAGQDPSQVFFA